MVISVPGGEEVAKKKSGRTTKKVILRILAAILAIIIVVGASTVQQLFAVTGMKNEGNSDTYNPENVTMKADSPIKGKKLLWLGSSVFQGFGARNTSPALWIDAMDGTISTIEVKGGTFLASIDGSIGGVPFRLTRPISTVCATILPRLIPIWIW